MDEVTRRRLAKDHNTLRNSIRLDMHAETPTVDAELQRMGVPRHANINPASALLAVPGGLMTARGLSLDQCKELLEIAFLIHPRDPYDIAAVDTYDLLDRLVGEIANDDDNARFHVELWVRLYRNAYNEMVFAIEDAVDVFKTDGEIVTIAKAATVFLLETFYIAANPQHAS